MIRKSWTIVGVSVGALWACGGRSMSALERPSDGDSSASAGSAHQAMGAAGGEQASYNGGSAQAGGDSTGDNGGSARAGGDSTGDNGGSAQAGGDSTGVGSAGTAGRVAGIGGQADLGAAGGQSVTGADGLRASYSFDETSGSTATETLSQARVPIYFASRVEGVVGNALGFGAPSARVEALPVGSFPTGQISVELWIRPNSLAPGGIAHLVGDGGGGIESFRVQLREGKVALLLAGGEGMGAEPIITSKSSVKIDRWQLITVTFDGSTARVYLDGKQDVSKSVLTPILFSGNTLFVGALRNLTGEVFSDQFDGAIDELKVWDQAVPADTVASHFQTAK